MTCTRKGAACGTVECRGCGITIKPADPSATMTPHDWLIVMSAIMAGAPHVTEDMQREFEVLNAKVTYRYNAAMEGRCVP